MPVPAFACLLAKDVMPTMNSEDLPVFPSPKNLQKSPFANVRAHP